MDKIRRFFKAYSDELIKKVTWPSIEELQSSTVTVLFASLLLAIAIAVMDLVFSTGMEFVYDLFYPTMNR
jgi:preprotein translocase subunit SecE